jgi:hypothetical protein
MNICSTDCEFSTRDKISLIVHDKHLDELSRKSTQAALARAKAHGFAALYAMGRTQFC